MGDHSDMVNAGKEGNYFSSCILHVLKHGEEDLKQEFAVTDASNVKSWTEILVEGLERTGWILEMQKSTDSI